MINMKQSLLSVLFLFFTLHTAFSQDPFPKNSFYLEAGGGGGFSSLNYERQLTKNPGIGIRIGAGFYTEAGFYLSIPVGINYLFPLKKKNHFIDAGFNVTPFFKDARFDAKGDDQYTSFIPMIGYRAQTDKNWFWRVSVGAVANRFGGLPWAGIAIGKVF